MFSFITLFLMMIGEFILLKINAELFYILMIFVYMIIICLISYLIYLKDFKSY